MFEFLYGVYRACEAYESAFSLLVLPNFHLSFFTVCHHEYVVIAKIPSRSGTTVQSDWDPSHLNFHFSFYISNYCEEIDWPLKHDKGDTSWRGGTFQNTTPTSHVLWILPAIRTSK
jgi:hypothetical protein